MTIKNTFRLIILVFGTPLLVFLMIKDAKSGWIDDIQTAITGHATDLYGRLTHVDDETNGDVYYTGVINEEANGQDAIHWAKGDISIVKEDDKYWVFLHPNFSAGLAPDLFLYVSNVEDIDNEWDFHRTKQIEIGKLKAGSGAQVYELPTEIDPFSIKSVTVWCKAFSEYMGSATVSSPSLR